MFNLAAHGLEELDTDLRTGRIILDKEHVRLLGTPHGVRLAHLSCSRWCCWVDKRLRNRGFGQQSTTSLLRQRVGDLVNVVGMERIDANGLANRVDGISVEVAH